MDLAPTQNLSAVRRSGMKPERHLSTWSSAPSNGTVKIRWPLPLLQPLTHNAAGSIFDLGFLKLPIAWFRLVEC